MDDIGEDFRPASEVFSTDFDTNLLQKIPTSNENNVPRESLYVKFDPLYAKQNNNNNNSDHLGQSASEDFHDSSERREVAAMSPDSPVDNLARSTASNPIKSKSPVTENLLDLSRTSENGMEDERSQLINNTSSADHKPLNNNQPKTYTESDLQDLLSSVRGEEKRKWEHQQQLLQNQIHEKSEQIKGLENTLECSKTLSMDKAPPVDESMDLKIIATLNNQFAEKLIESRKKSQEMLTRHIQKLSADNSEILKEMDVMHNAMSDLHKRYDKAREIINEMKKREDVLEEKIRVYAENLKASEENCRMISKSCDEQLEAANDRIEETKLETQKEKIHLEASNKRLEIENKSLQTKFLDKESQVKELIAICDNLMGVKEQELEEGAAT